MALMIDYGIVCKASDERTLVRNVNAFLASEDYFTLSKHAPAHIQPAARAFRIAHVYRQFLKQHPRWYFDLTPNLDLDGRARFPNDLDCGWTLFTNKPAHDLNSPEEDASLDAFFARLAAGAGFLTRILHEYHKVGEDRL